MSIPWDIGCGLLWGASYATGAALGRPKPVIEKTFGEYVGRFFMDFVMFVCYYVLIIFSAAFLLGLGLGAAIIWNQRQEEKKLPPTTWNLDSNVILECCQKYLPPELCQMIQAYLETGFSFRLRTVSPPPSTYWRQHLDGTISVFSDCTISVFSEPYTEQLVYRLPPSSSPLQNDEEAEYKIDDWRYDSKTRSINLLLRVKGRLKNVTLHVPPEFCVREQWEWEFGGFYTHTSGIGLRSLGPNLILIEDSTPRQYYWKIPADFHQREDSESEPFHCVITEVISSQQQYLIRDSPLCGAETAAREIFADYRKKYWEKPIVCTSHNVLVRWDPRHQVMTVLIIYDDHHYEILRQKLKTSAIREMFLCHERGKYQIWLINRQTGYWAVMD
jgi:hypothetical protein